MGSLKKVGKFDIPLLFFTQHYETAKAYGNLILAFKAPYDSGNWISDGFNGYGIYNLEIDRYDLYIVMKTREGTHIFFPLGDWHEEWSDNLPEDQYLENGAELEAEIGDVVYHGTSFENIESIKDRGLRPGFNNNSYFNKQK